MTVVPLSYSTNEERYEITQNVYGFLLGTVLACFFFNVFIGERLGGDGVGWGWVGCGCY